MKRHGLALIIAGHLRDHKAADSEKEPSSKEAQLDAMKGLMDAKDPEEALACLKDLLELLKGEEEEPEEDDEPDEATHSW